MQNPHQSFRPSFSELLHMPSKLATQSRWASTRFSPLCTVDHNVLFTTLLPFLGNSWLPIRLKCELRWEAIIPRRTHAHTHARTHAAARSFPSSCFCSNTQDTQSYSYLCICFSFILLLTFFFLPILVTFVAMIKYNIKTDTADFILAYGSREGVPTGCGGMAAGSWSREMQDYICIHRKGIGSSRPVH